VLKFIVYNSEILFRNIISLNFSEIPRQKLHRKRTNYILGWTELQENGFWTGSIKVEVAQNYYKITIL